ncbi:MAG: hypothetical protein KID00_03990 [Clostridium argentinense]|uniref:Uncharacterized protein n=1 Tax=Clostridium faecium TaxID=2762223 RepID=A0ABR8YR96_9CLOT|nr:MULTISPECIES: hypothetical protein [Clostridium]MBD8046511.1 hypothetical protein [Clostridium faecium]MBS5823016.1 hypothetical protein [Clostridium argentinense]MDU1349174.1 hypothetical protein [Clostridium argentinense]
MKKSLKILAGIVIAIFTVSIAGFLYIKSIKLPDIKIKDIDIKNISDGSYFGEYEAGPVRVEVIKLRI